MAKSKSSGRDKAPTADFETRVGTGGVTGGFERGGEATAPPGPGGRGVKVR